MAKSRSPTTKVLWFFSSDKNPSVCGDAARGRLCPDHLVPAGALRRVTGRSKAFFFKKKKQKTFDHFGFGLSG